MELWKKESAGNDACYVDLMPPDQVDWQGIVLFEYHKSTFGNVQKSDMVSAELRKEGNELSEAENWAEAIEKYNKCICFAINGSENLGFGYANRSACFLHLKMYDKCLADIELARKANYPENKMHKLDKRKADCLKAMKESIEIGETKRVTPKLDFTPHSEFPGLANILDVYSNAEFGKHIVAKCDIDVGKIVMLEDVYAFGADFKCQTVCKTCIKPATNFIPCPNCADVMFCSTQCMESNSMHKKVCGALYNRWFRDVIIVETILLAVSAFANSESLIEFVESALASRDLDSAHCESDDQIKYRLFLKLFALPRGMISVRVQIIYTYKLLLEIPFIEQFFFKTSDAIFDASNLATCLHFGNKLFQYSSF